MKGPQHNRDGWKMTIQLKTLLVALLLAGSVMAAGPLITDTPIDAGIIPYPESDPAMEQELSRALIDSNAPRSQVLMQTTQTWDGGSFAYPPGEAEVTAVRISLPDGHQADYHCHPMPTFGYIASGRLRVDTRNGDSTEFKAGDVVSEVMNTLHRGTAVEGPVELLVFYAGAKGQQNTYKEEEEGVSPCES